MDTVDIILLLIVGLLAGTAASSIFMRGHTNALVNTILGIAGAILGQFVLDVLDLDLPSALNEGISMAAVLTAFIGAAIVLLIARGIRR